MKNKNKFWHGIGAMIACLVSMFLPSGKVYGMASYNKVNAETLADLTTMSPKAKEELWVKRIIMGADQDNVFSDNMIGGPDSGKPFVTYDDLSKVAGDTINIPLLAPLGGPGTQGEGDRIGNEEKMQIGNMQVQIGRQWYGVGITDVAIEQTVIGSKWDNLVNGLLRERLGRKKSEDMLMVLRANADQSNTIRPNFKATREQLRSADVVGTQVISKSGINLSSLGGKPIKMGKGGAGDSIEQYLFFGHQHGLQPLRTETAYLEAVRHAQNRGNTNPLFKGDYSDWDGHGIYRWYLRDHDAAGPVGSVLLPRAFLGEAIEADNEAITLKGGGRAARADLIPAPLYFEDFSNYGYKLTNGIVYGLDTVTERYLAIQNLTGADVGKIGIYAFQVNSGNTITITKRLRATGDVTGDNIAYTTVGNVTWNAGAWPAAGNAGFAGLTDSHPEGSLIVEINSYGVPFCYSLMLGQMAAACGHGSLSNGSGKGRRTEEHRNHGMDHGIGIECVFGSAVIKRTDNKVPGYVLVEHAYAIDGFPVIV